MAKIRIVTDSAAQFLDPGSVARYGITVIPHTLTIGGQRFHENVDLDSASFFKLAGQTAESLPVLTPPTVAQFTDVYRALHRETDQILSIHLSAAMSTTSENAIQATHSPLGRCTIQVIDSMTASVGLAHLVEAAAKLAETTDSIDYITRLIRK